jgi:hypothetical protein
MPVARQHSGCRRDELECQPERSGRSAYSWQVTTLGLFRFLPSSSSWLRVTVPASASGPGSGCPAAARRRSESPGLRLVYFDSDSDPDSANLKAGPLARHDRDWHGAGWQRHRFRACHTGRAVRGCAPYSASDARRHHDVPRANHGSCAFVCQRAQGPGLGERA